MSSWIIDSSHSSKMETPSSSDTFDHVSQSLIFFRNDFPSGNLQQMTRRLHKYSKDRRFSLLALFLDDCTAVLKGEVTRLPQFLKETFPHFDTVLTLAEDNELRDGPLCAAMGGVLLCVLQLGLMIGHYESQDIPYGFGAHSTLAGLSTGLFAGAAVSLSRSLADLAKNGSEAVRVAFRLGVYVDDTSRKLESSHPDGTPQSWAHCVPAVSQDKVQAEIERYNTETDNPSLTKVFISAADKASVIVSGPPSRIKDAFQYQQSLRYSKALPLPIYDGQCHASHVYGGVDIDQIINGPEAKIRRDTPVEARLLSSQTGEPFASTKAGDLFLEIATELLTRPVYMDNVSDGILDIIRQSEAVDCEVLLFGTNMLSNATMKAINEELPQVKLSRSDLMDWVNKDFGPRQPRSCKDSKLAIVGMACRMPGGANDTELFWNLIEEGRDVHTTVPADRFDLSTHYDPTGQTENATQTPWGNFIDNPGMFDAGFFNMSPREAEQTDPMHRLALVTAYEALEMAGYVPNRTSSTRLGRIGTFYGQASDDWRELNASQNIGTYAVPGGERAFANGRINYFFKFGGPSFNIDTACSSGLAAVHAACSALWNGDADTVLAGGLNIITDPDNYAGLGGGHFLSKTGQCKVWDKDADGYCRADGVGSVVIKRLEDAEADNDKILAVVLSANTNHSADALSITQPHAGAQIENYTRVLQKSGVDPLSLSYVELHGTGTQVGDAVESESVLSVFAPPGRRPKDNRLHLGAVKCNIGHGEAAAGISSLLKVLLMYQKNQIPRHIGIQPGSEINPIIPKDLQKRNAALAEGYTPWPRPRGKSRLALVNSFGAHGGNTTLLLEDAPERGRLATNNARSAHVVAVSAKSKASLENNITNLLAYLEEHPDTDLGDLSYTTCGRRIHHSMRKASAFSSIEQLKDFLAESVETVSDVRPILADTPPVAFVFTGQGAYYSGMGRALFQDFPYFRFQVLQLDYLVQRLGFASVIPVIDGSTDEECPPVTAQLSIVVIQIALVSFWKLLGVTPSLVIGHSLGEYAALVTAGVVSEADALFLVGRRAELVTQSCSTGNHVMLSVRAGLEEIKQKAGSAEFEVSCYNGPEDIVLGGAQSDIEQIQRNLESQGVRCVKLDLPFAFHTAQMEVILGRFEKIASHVSFKAPGVPIVSPLLGDCVFDSKSVDARYLRRATREPVNFTQAITAARGLGIIDEKTMWLEIGPNPICSGFLRNILGPGTQALSSFRRNEDNFITLSKTLSNLYLVGIPILWQEYFRPHESGHELLHLKKYSWNEKNYWIDYIGTWTLDKAHLKANGGKLPGTSAPIAKNSALRTSSIHQIIVEEVRQGSGGRLTTMSDMQHPDFLAAVHGHRMNNCGVATSSIWSDMAFTVGEYLYKLVSPMTKQAHMNLADVVVFHGQVAKKGKGAPQLLILEADLDLAAHSMSLSWSNATDDGQKAPGEPFATGTIHFEDPGAWRREWSRIQHLVQGRIDALSAAAYANRLNRNMAYTLFKNVVDYALRYRGMQTVVLSGHEAFADVALAPESHGTWHTPPHWIDSVSHLAGLVMNASDASDTRDYFYVTPGCETFRLLRPLSPAARYRSYVRMFALPGEPGMHAGDLYILDRDSGEIVGEVGQLRFRRVARLLMDKFFSPPDEAGAGAGGSHPHDRVSAPDKIPAVSEQLAVVPGITAQSAERTTPEATVPVSTTNALGTKDISKPSHPETKNGAAASSGAVLSASGIVNDCIGLIARETGLEASKLNGESTFVQLGVDSLMSLVLSEKFRAELSLEIKSSLFLECPTIGEFTAWLEQYC